MQLEYAAKHKNRWYIHRHIHITKSRVCTVKSIRVKECGSYRKKEKETWTWTHVLVLTNCFYNDCAANVCIERVAAIIKQYCFRATIKFKQSTQKWIEDKKKYKHKNLNQTKTNTEIELCAAWTRYATLLNVNITHTFSRQIFPIAWHSAPITNGSCVLTCAFIHQF